VAAGAAMRQRAACGGALLAPKGGRQAPREGRAGAGRVRRAVMEVARGGWLLCAGGREERMQTRESERPRTRKNSPPPCFPKARARTSLPHTHSPPHHGHGGVRYVALASSDRVRPRPHGRRDRQAVAPHFVPPLSNAPSPSSSQPTLPPCAPYAPPGRRWRPAGRRRRRVGRSSLPGKFCLSLDAAAATVGRRCAGHLPSPSSFSRLLVLSPPHAHSAERRDGGGFVSGFILGGVVFGALGFLFAPQVSDGERRRRRSKKGGTSNPALALSL
jgi:hypothetical protein